MSRSDLALLFLGAAPYSFLVGVIVGLALCQFTEHHPKGHLMTGIGRLLEKIGGWLVRGHRMVVFTVLIGLVAVAAFGYAVASDKRSGTRDDRTFACFAHFVDATNQAQVPRTAASTEASDARRDWDRGYSRAADARGLTKAELKVRYLMLYAEYEKVRDRNPLPKLSPAYCRAVTR